MNECKRSRFSPFPWRSRRTGKAGWVSRTVLLFFVALSASAVVASVTPVSASAGMLRVSRASLERELAKEYAEKTVCTSGPCDGQTFTSTYHIKEEDRKTGDFSGTITNSSDGYEGKFTGTVSGERVTIHTSKPDESGYTATSTGRFDAKGVISGTFTDSLGNAGSFTMRPEQK